MSFRKNLIFSLVLILMFSVFAVACGNQASKSSGEEAAQGSSESSQAKSEENDKIVIGAALPDFDDKWLSYLQDGMRDFERSQENLEVIYVDAQNDASKQLSQIENFISQKVDAIAIVPVDTVSAVNMVEKANDAGIPIVVVNRIFDEIDKATAYVGGRSIESGIIQMKEVAKLLDGKGNIAIMHGQSGHEAEIKRTEGNKQIIAEYPDMQVVLEGTADWDRAKGLSLMENWLNSGKHIDAVVANNDEMAIGAIMALEAAGKLDEVVVAGIDGTIDALDYVKSGKLDVSVFQDPFAQGRGGLEAALKAAQGEEIEKMNYIPYELINKDNYQDYIDKWNSF